MTSEQQPVLHVGDIVGWTGFLKSIMGSRRGTIVDVLASPTKETEFTRYLVLRDDGVEGVYLPNQLEPVARGSKARKAAAARSS